MKTAAITLSLLIAVLFTSTVSFAQAPAKLIVYRKGSPYGALAKYQVNVDSKNQSSLKGNSVYSTTLTPGSHTISPKQRGRSLKLNAEPGKTYVVKYKTRIGIFGARPKLKLVSVESANKDFQIFSQALNDVVSCCIA